MITHHPKLFVVSAPSGTGKSTLCSRLLNEVQDLVLSISTTTRKPRGQEQDGKEYFFVDRNLFQKKIQDGEFAEWAEVHGNFYGTSHAVIQSCLKSGKSVLLDIDVQGAESLRKAYPKQCVSIFISPPSLDILETRLRGRGTESEEVIRKRMKNAIQEMAEKPKFHFEIVNDELERAFAELKSLVQKQMTRKP